MLTAKDIMTSEVITISPDTEVAQAAKLLLTNRINGVPVVSDTGELVGAGGLNDVQHAHGKAELGFWLVPSSWGLGIMAEALPAILDYGFLTLRLHRIEGFVETDNERCRRALNKFGFVHEGQLRESETKDGRYISLDVFSLLEHDPRAPSPYRIAVRRDVT